MVHQTMKTSTPRASKASAISNHMGRSALRTVGVAILGALAACAVVPPASAPAPIERRVPASVSATVSAPDSTSPSAGARAAAPGATGATSTAGTDAASSASVRQAPASGPAPTVLTRGNTRWVSAQWSELPGFGLDRSTEVWPALQAGCTRPAVGWSELCARALLEPPPTSDTDARRWLMARLDPWRVEAADGLADGLATGYFEPTIDAVRRRQGRFRVPLFAPPPDLASRRPYYTRQQIDALPAAAAALAGQEIAWIEDPLDALLLSVQGSGRLRVTEPDGQVRLRRLAFAAHNEQPYRSLGRWLIEQGELTADTASWPAIKAWARKNPSRLQALLWANPRVVFYREEALTDPDLGPRGAIGVPLTPGRSIAVDPRALPHGSVVWLDTTEPLSSTPMQRLVMAQDSGSAITGPVRADVFFGWDRQAETLAGRMKQPLRLWVLWPKGKAPPETPAEPAQAAVGRADDAPPGTGTEAAQASRRKPSDAANKRRV
jgi:membrane-bound lytic murein transglycosylase A